MTPVAARLLLTWLKTWLYLRPFRTVLWALAAMALGFGGKHALGLGTTALEVTVLVSNLCSLLLGGWATVNSYGDYRYQLAADGNGKTEVADEEVGQDAMRVAAAATLLVVAIMLLHAAPNFDYEALVAKHGMLFASWYLLAAIARERISRYVLVRARKRAT